VNEIIEQFERISKYFNKSDVADWRQMMIFPEMMGDFEQKELTLISSIRDSLEFESPALDRSLFGHIREKYKGQCLVIGVIMPYPLVNNLAEYPYGRIDAFAWEADYHKLHQTLFETLVSQVDLSCLKSEKEPLEYEICVDTSPYIDREIAYILGLGQYGKNHNLLNRKFGSHFTIGYVLLSVGAATVNAYQKMSTEEKIGLHFMEHEYLKEPQFEGCNNCTICESACPTQICGNIKMDRKKCLSYVTQSKGYIDETMQVKMKNILYGCSICQQVCPFNQPIEKSDLPAINVWDLLKMSNRSFKSEYGDRGFAWRGLKVFKRNAIILIKNNGSLGDIKKLSTEDYRQLWEDPFYKVYLEKGKL